MAIERGSQPFRLILCFAIFPGGDAPGFDVSGFQPAFPKRKCSEVIPVAYLYIELNFEVDCVFSGNQRRKLKLNKALQLNGASQAKLNWKTNVRTKNNLHHNTAIQPFPVKIRFVFLVKSNSGFVPVEHLPNYAVQVFFFCFNN